MSIKKNLIEIFKSSKFTLKEAYDANSDMPKESVRARIYENLGTAFRKIDRGIYMTIAEDAIVIEGSGRNLRCLEDSSIDCIITDHPWNDTVSTKGGNRNFASYPVFNYEQCDFDEKARVLKEGSFLCEVIPAESESNFDYLYQIKKMAQAAGFQYYAKVAWKKGTFVSNTGRKAKNTEDIMIFSKGKPRALKPDKQRGLDENGNPTRYMSGTNGMLPTCFDVQPVPKKEIISQSEKPTALFEQLLEYVTLPGEIVLDQFAGSGAVGEACIKKNRKAILVELVKEKATNIAKRLHAVMIDEVLIKKMAV